MEWIGNVLLCSKSSQRFAAQPTGNACRTDTVTGVKKLLGEHKIMGQHVHL